MSPNELFGICLQVGCQHEVQLDCTHLHCIAVSCPDNCVLAWPVGVSFSSTNVHSLLAARGSFWSLWTPVRKWWKKAKAGDKLVVLSRVSRVLPGKLTSVLWDVAWPASWIL